MDPLVIPPILCAIFALTLAILVTYRQKPRPINRSFSLLCLATFNWQLCWYITYFLASSFQKEFTVRIAFSSIVYIPVLYYEFVTRFFGLMKEMKRVSHSYLVCTFFLLLTWVSNFYVAGFREFPWGIYGKAGSLYSLFVAFVFIIICRTLILLIRGTFSKQITSFEKNRRRFVFAAYFLYCFASIEFLINYGFDFYPVGVLFILASTSVMAYAIVRHNLMDITVAITRTTVFIGVYALLLGLPVLAALSLELQLEQLLGSRWWVWLWIICAFSTTVAHYVNLYLQRKTGDSLLREQRKYQRTLLAASTGMTRIKELNRLLSLIVHMLTKEVRLAHAGVFLWDAENENYVLKNARDREQLIPGMRVGKDDPLIGHLKQERDALVYEELNAQLAGQTGNERASPKLPPPTILETMKRIGGAVVVPGFAAVKLPCF